MCMCLDIFKSFRLGDGYPIFAVLGECPSQRQDLEGVSENVNALLENSIASVRARNGSTQITGINININSSLTSVCEILPTIPAMFYCRTRGHNVRFRVAYKLHPSSLSAFVKSMFPNIMVSEMINKSNLDSLCICICIYV